MIVVMARLRSTVPNTAPKEVPIALVALRLDESSPVITADEHH